jgi:NTE family protein
LSNSRDAVSNRSIGLALGSGSARGWAHIGVIRELSRLEILPDLICGTSVGALVGAVYVSGHLDMLESWVQGLTNREIVRYLDLSLLWGGGVVEGKRLMDFFRNKIGDINIEDLPRPFASVATDFATGQEIWIREGSLWEAVRVSIALPGIFTPARRKKQLLVDGGLVNPVPVSLCRAMGAEFVVAVNLNGDIVGRHLTKCRNRKHPGRRPAAEANLLDKLPASLKKTASVISRLRELPPGTPGLFTVLAGSINIMQDRITRARIAADPPDVLLSPNLAQIGLLEFDRATEAIAEGRACVRRSATQLRECYRFVKTVPPNESVEE